MTGVCSLICVVLGEAVHICLAQCHSTMATLYEHSLSKLNANLHPPASPANSVDSDPGYGTLDFPKKVMSVSSFDVRWFADTDGLLF